MATSLTYNGVQLNVLKVKNCNAQAVSSKDGCDYLYTKFRLEVTGLINKAWHSWTSAGVANTGTLPINSTAWLQGWLLTKRRNLSFGVYSSADVKSYVLCSPFKEQGDFDALTELSTARRAACDAEEGPNPLYCNIIRIDNEGAVLVDYGIEFCLRMVNTDTMADTETPNTWPLLQSNRWTMSEEVTEDYFAVRIIEGIAEFRPDALIARHVSADTLRKELMHPIPKGMRRERIKVTAESHGRTLRYSFVDRQLVLPGGPKFPFTRPEITYTVSGGQQPMQNGGFSPMASKIFSMRGTGPPNVSRYDMLVCAVTMGIQHLARDRILGKPDGFMYITNCEITYLKHVNYISVLMAARCNIPAEGMAVAGKLDGGLLISNSGLTKEDDLENVNTPLEALPGNGGNLDVAFPPQDDCRPINFGHALLTAALKGEAERLDRPPPYDGGGQGGGGNGNQ